MNEQIDLFGGVGADAATVDDAGGEPATVGDATPSGGAVSPEHGGSSDSSARPEVRATVREAGPTSEGTPAGTRARSAPPSGATNSAQASGRRVPAPTKTSTTRTPPTLLVIDGTALLFRVYYGMPGRIAPSGVEVGAVMGVCHQLLGITRRRSEEHIVVVYDAGQETFRNGIDPSYKANRGDPPEDLVPQFDLVKEASAALGFPSLSLVGYEADDLMATLAARAREAGMGARLVAIDKDLCQAVTDEAPAVDICDPKSDALMDAAGVRERLGVDPSQVVDFMALTGDSTDNIKGVKGVGPKAAQALLGAFGSLDGILDNIDRIEFLSVRGAKGLAKKMEAGREDALLARRLVRLDDAVPMGIDRATIAAAGLWRGPQPEAETFFGGLGIRGPLAGFHRLYEQRVGAL